MSTGRSRFTTYSTSVTWQQVKPGVMAIIGIWGLVAVIEIATLAFSIVADSGLAVAATGVFLVISVIALGPMAFGVTRGKTLGMMGLAVRMSGVVVFQVVHRSPVDVSRDQRPRRSSP